MSGSNGEGEFEGTNLIAARGPLSGLLPNPVKTGYWAFDDDALYINIYIFIKVWFTSSLYIHLPYPSLENTTDLNVLFKLFYGN